MMEAEDASREDGTSIAGTLVRLAWHASGTYSKVKAAVVFLVCAHLPCLDPLLMCRPDSLDQPGRGCKWYLSKHAPYDLAVVASPEL